MLINCNRIVARIVSDLNYIMRLPHVILLFPVMNIKSMLNIFN